MVGYQTEQASDPWSGLSLGIVVGLFVAENLYFDIAGLPLSYGRLGLSERLS